MTFDHEGYEWHETTTTEDMQVGRRVFIKGRSLNRVTELVHGIETLATNLEARSQSPGAQKLARELRALL